MSKTIISDVKLNARPEVPYLGIRVQTPFKGMFKVVSELSNELTRYVEKCNVKSAGHPFLRYHAINMTGEMDIEFGIPIGGEAEGNERITTASLPAGRYTSLVYIGHGLVGNKALLVWAKERNIVLDKWESPQGDCFRSRCEFYLTDPKLEPRKTKWEIEVAIKIA
jgi:effector-binding domain-containing protein